MGAMEFFGEPYPTRLLPAPIYEDISEVPTPIGLLCFSCDELIEDGDRGFIQSCVIRTDEHGEYVHTREPIHHECHMRSVVGSVKHQRGECGCATGDFSGDDDAEYATRREAARAAVSEFETRNRVFIGLRPDGDE
jgi:hypothetical protein